MTDGDFAWIGLALYVAAYDALAVASGRDTLSGSFARAIDHPVRRWPTMAVWAALTAHLFKAIPARFDPLRHA
jgi:hypothetical protein